MKMHKIGAIIFNALADFLLIEAKPAQTQGKIRSWQI